MELIIEWADEDLNLVALRALLREEGVVLGDTEEVGEHEAQAAQGQPVPPGGALPARLL